MQMRPAEVWSWQVHNGARLLDWHETQLKVPGAPVNSWYVPLLVSIFSALLNYMIATSVDVERLFSRGRLLLSHVCSCLTATHDGSYPGSHTLYPRQNLYPWLGYNTSG